MRGFDILARGRNDLPRHAFNLGRLKIADIADAHRLLHCFDEKSIVATKSIKQAPLIYG